MAALRFQRIPYEEDLPLTRFDDYSIFQTKAWLKFIADTQGGEPVVAYLYNDGCFCGRFSGLIIKRFGLRILGSPLPGWTTGYMGFNMLPSVSRKEALNGLEKFAVEELNCVHVEIMDRQLCTADFENAGYVYKLFSGYEVDLTKPEEELFAAIDPSCRRCIRKAERSGVRIERADDAAFADDYYAQLKDVFVKQKLVPTYSRERVRVLVRDLLPSGRLLLLRARNSGGKCIATGIFPAINNMMYFWGGASWRQYQHLRPNELIQWHAMRYWKSKNIATYDMGGGGDYKRKFGGYSIAIPWGRKSRYPVLENIRSVRRGAFTLRQNLMGRLLYLALCLYRHLPFHSSEDSIGVLSGKNGNISLDTYAGGGLLMGYEILLELVSIVG